MKKILLITSLFLSTVSFAQEWETVEKYDYNWRNANVLTVKDGVFTSTFVTNKYKVLIEHMHINLHTKKEVEQFYTDIENSLPLKDAKLVRDNYTIISSKKYITFIVGDDVSTLQPKKYIKPNKGFLKTKNEVIKFM